MGSRVIRTCAAFLLHMWRVSVCLVNASSFTLSPNHTVEWTASPDCCPLQSTSFACWLFLSNNQLTRRLPTQAHRATAQFLPPRLPAFDFLHKKTLFYPELRSIRWSEDTAPTSLKKILKTSREADQWHLNRSSNKRRQASQWKQRHEGQQSGKSGWFTLRGQWLNGKQVWGKAEAQALLHVRTGERQVTESGCKSEGIWWINGEKKTGFKSSERRTKTVNMLSLANHSSQISDGSIKLSSCFVINEDGSFPRRKKNVPNAKSLVLLYHL